MKHSSVDHVEKWKVPVMMVHCGKVFRVVETRGMATSGARQRKGMPSQFLYFPHENHSVLKPANSILWHETMLPWLGKWTRQK